MSTEPLSRRDLMRGAVLVGVAASAAGAEIAAAGPAAAAVPEPRVFTTGEWSARPPSEPVTVISSNPDKIVVHHTATSNDVANTRDRAFTLARAIQNFHMDTRGWIDTAQHFTISRGGYLLEGRHKSLRKLRDGSGMVVGDQFSGPNRSAVSIENEGNYMSATPPSALYDKLVDLCAYAAQQYSIPVSRIYGHRDFDQTACPGDVLYRMLPQLRDDVADRLAAWSTTVDNATAGRFSASGSWGVSSWSGQRHGADYRYASPVFASDPAWFKVNIPSAGNHRVEVWHPSNSGYNSAAPHVIVTSDGNQVVHVDQRTGGGAWRSLGVFPLAAGDRNVVAVSRWTSASGYVIADAVRITRV